MYVTNLLLLLRACFVHICLPCWFSAQLPEIHHAMNFIKFLLAHHKCNVFMAFLAGLLEEIKGKVELKNPKTLDELLSAAVQVEKSVVKPQKA